MGCPQAHRKPPRSVHLHLGAKVETCDLADIKAVLEKSHDPVAQEHLVDEHVDVLETYSWQAQIYKEHGLSFRPVITAHSCSQQHDPSFGSPKERRTPAIEG